MAIGNKKISQMLAAPLNEVEFDVLQDEVIHRNYLNDMIEQTSPDMVLIHDKFLQSDFDGDDEKRDQEMLELIEYWRIQYNDKLRVVYFAIRERTDPFIADLVARNVRDIFNENSLVTLQMVEQLLEPPKYQNVIKFGVGNVELKDEIIEADEDSIEDVTEVDERSESRMNDTVQSLKGSLKSIVQTASKSVSNQIDKNKIKSILENNTDVQEVIEMMPLELQKKFTRSTVIGTVLIGIAGVTPNTGCTNTAISLAKVLTEKGHTVALVESNNSGDFDRIHSLYEGVKTKIAESEFEIYGVTHFKYRSTLDLDEIFSTFEYVIMDYGDLYSAFNQEQFKRSHLKLVHCSADEWKYYQVKDFEQLYQVDSSYCFMLPNAGIEKRDQLEEQLKLKQAYLYPQMDNPYEPPKEVTSMLPSILGEFFREPSKSNNKVGLFWTGSLSVVITLLIVLIFKLIN